MQKKAGIYTLSSGYLLFVCRLFPWGLVVFEVVFFVSALLIPLTFFNLS